MLYPTELIQHDPSCFEGEGLSTLCQIITDAVRETAGSSNRQKMSTCHSGISHTGYKIEAKEIASICQLLTEVVITLRKCKENGTHHPDYSTSGTLSSRDPCMKMEDILFPVMRSKSAKACFTKLVDGYTYNAADDQIAHIREPSFYVGPVRNSTPWNYLSALPIVQLAPFLSSVDELAEAWHWHVTKEQFEILEKPTYLMYNEKRIHLGKNIKLVDVIDMDMKKHYFCLPQLKWKDEKSVDRLMEFIEGGKLPEQGAEKKKGKKKRASRIGIAEGEADRKAVIEAKPHNVDQRGVSATSTGSRAGSEVSSGSKQETKGEREKNQGTSASSRKGGEGRGSLGDEVRIAFL